MTDLQTNPPDTDYFFLGDGRMMATIQWSRNPALSPYGLLICDPERMSRKNGSLLFHPEHGLARTMLTAIVDGVRYSPQHGDVQVAWKIERNPSVVVRWKAADVEISERFFVQGETSNLVRDVIVSTDHPCRVEVEAAFYANPLFFDEFGCYPSSMLYANGYVSMSLYATPEGRAFERFLTVGCDVDAESRGIVASFVYALQAVGTHEFSLYPSEFEFPIVQELASPVTVLGASVDAALDRQSELHHLPTLAPRIEELYNVARISLRAGVSQLGKFDASIWQYDFEWGMDAAMVATAATCSGNFNLAREVLLNILTRLSNDAGMIAEASRFRGGELSELNGNGAVLDALWHYWRWSGDDETIRAHWPRIAAIADYPLRPEFQHPSGLLKTRRDFWERYPWMGVGEGFELGHQVYCVVGLRRAGEMASALGHVDAASRWSAAAERIRDAMFGDPKFSLIEDGAFIHRRLIDGSVQTTLAADTAYHDVEYARYIPTMTDAARTPKPCEPDVTEALPIVYALIDAHDGIAQRTMEKLRALWNPTGIGGYARYNVASDPDSPGPWPFATAFVAAAEIEVGLDERAHETINWLLEKAGAGGCWFEYYGERQSPPFPPVGVIVWGWAQYILLVVKHIAGVRVADGEIRITPKLIGLEHTVRFGGHTIRIAVRGLGSATLDGQSLALDGQTARIALPLEKDHRLEFLQ